jgi:hypothetical protein
MLGFLRPPSILNVDVYAAPFDDPSGCVGYRTSTEEEPAILAVEALQARFYFA